MPSTSSADRFPALRSLRQPIEAFTPESSLDLRFRGSILGLAERLEDLWSRDEDDTLESDVVSTALYAFPALTASGPAPERLIAMAASGRLIDVETAELLRTLTRVRRILSDHRPPGVVAALWRAILLAVYRLLELLVLIDDDRVLDRCFELLDTLEILADHFSGAA